MNKPYSQACENNKQPILQVIQQIFIESMTVWEIGSGTGQHACFFAQQLPHLTWQATDKPENREAINLWIEQAALTNLPPCLALDVSHPTWPCQQIEALFSANTLHIMHWQTVECFFSGLNRYLNEHATVCLYGPFNYKGQYTSVSNQQFDNWLKTRDPQSGIRDFEAIVNLAETANLQLKNDFSMPANNRLLVLQRD